MSEHFIGARAELADWIRRAEARLSEVRAIHDALCALDGDAVPPTPMVRPPAPDIAPPPVEMPKVPTREQRPAAAKVDNRGIAMRKAAAEMVDCPDCDRQLSKLGLGPHRRAAHGLVSTPPPAAAPRFVEQVAARAAVPEVSGTFACVTCDAQFTDKRLLADHTIKQHGRGPVSGELIAVEAAA